VYHVLRLLALLEWSKDEIGEHVIALQAGGLGQAKPTDRPRLLSDNGSSYVAGGLGKWLDADKI
jgi:hypothetical protein